MHTEHSSTLPPASSTRPILRAGPVRAAPSPQAFRAGRIPNPSPLVPRRRRAHATAACETCWKRKVKCNEARPACGYCVSAVLNCVYPTVSADQTHAQALKRKCSEINDREGTYRQVFEHLRDRPESEVTEIVKRIRDGAGPESILRYIREGDLLLQLALTPETRYRYVFPLVQEMPEVLLRPDNPYLDSWLYEWVADGPSLSKCVVSSRQFHSAEQQSPYCKPHHAAELVDPLLSNAKPSEWTTVSLDDTMMRKTLVNYFLGDYHWRPMFQKDYFLQDMAAGRQGCCSSLLVNVVLALGTMAATELSGRYEYWNPRSLGYQFLAEARRIWEIETTSSRMRLTTIQAAMLLHFLSAMNGTDAFGFVYPERAMDMARQIGLFRSGSARRATRKNNARIFTAWALFCWDCTILLSCFEAPSLRSLPACELPDPSSNPEWYGQFWLRYPLDPKLYTTHFPHLFKAQVDLLVLNSEGWLQQYRKTSEQDWASGAALRAADGYYSRMKKWYDNLPEPLTLARITLPSQLLLHADYYNVIINHYEPLCNPDQAAMPLGQDAGGATPIQIRDTSIRHLETILRPYYLRHGYDEANGYLGRCLIQLGFMTLNKMEVLTTSTSATSNYHTPAPTTTTPSLSPQGILTALRSTLLLTAQGLHAQGASHFVEKAILRTLIAKMAPSEQQPLGRVFGGTIEAELAKPGVVAQMRQVRSLMVPSAVSFGDDPDEHRLGRLVEELGLGDCNCDGDNPEAKGDGQGEGDDGQE